MNLALHVVGQRADGYHLIESLVYFSLSGDCLSCTPFGSNRFVLTGPFADELVSDAENLVVRAHDFMCNTFPECAKPAFFDLLNYCRLLQGLVVVRVMLLVF